MDKEKLKSIINAGANALTTEQREYIYMCATELGIAYKRKLCKSCAIDLAVECVMKLSEGVGDGNASVRINDGVDVIVNGVRMNMATCDSPALCEWFLSLGAKRKYFTFNNNED